MKIAIIEDELPNRRLLIGMIHEFRPDWEIVREVGSVKQSVEWLSAGPELDLIFMDIQLTDGICFSIFESVKPECMVIFTTAYDEYAIQAFEVNSVDYLLKPIKQTKLEQAILKFEKLYHKSDNLQDESLKMKALIEAIGQPAKPTRQRFLVSGGASYFKLDVADIAYFVSENRITYAVTFNAKRHVIDMTLEMVEEELDHNQFFRAGRAHILHIDAISKVENYFGGKLVVKLIPTLSEVITVSRLKATAFKQWLGG